MNNNAQIDKNALVAPEGRCNYYIQKKRRFCVFKTKSGEKFCPMHSTNTKNLFGERKRIPCPLDPKQFVFFC